VKGRLVLSDGSPAASVNLFLGETNNYTMVQGAGYQYYGYTDDNGYFKIDNVRANQKYWLQAFSSEWSEAIDVVGNYTYPKQITVKEDQTMDLGKIKWSSDHHDTIWQIGVYDRTTKGFLHGAKKYENFQTEKCPGDYDFYVGETSYREWCYAKSKNGTWSVHFAVDQIRADKEAVLYVSIAGYTGNNSYVGGDSTKLKILVNGETLETDEYETQLYNDKSTYRSASFAGNWYYSKLPVPEGTLIQGNNTLELITEEYTPNYGILWDSLKLVWE
jgi:rhamnogalacturonan endolyase